MRGDEAVQQFAAKRQLHPTQVSTWKGQAVEGMIIVFSDKIKKVENKSGEIKELHAKRIIDSWIDFYNTERPHTSLAKRALDAECFAQVEIRKAA